MIIIFYSFISDCQQQKLQLQYGNIEPANPFSSNIPASPNSMFLKLFHSTFDVERSMLVRLWRIRRSLSFSTFFAPLSFTHPLTHALYLHPDT
jgi:hypothetical protein